MLTRDIFEDMQRNQDRHLAELAAYKQLGRANEALARCVEEIDHALRQCGDLATAAGVEGTRLRRLAGRLLGQIVAYDAAMQEETPC